MEQATINLMKNDLVNIQVDLEDLYEKKEELQRQLTLVQIQINKKHLQVQKLIEDL
jgi:hypothetical protein